MISYFVKNSNEIEKIMKNSKTGQTVKISINNEIHLISCFLMIFWKKTGSLSFGNISYSLLFLLLLSLFCFYF